MNVLSCFDGMSCGQIALNRAGIKYDKYFASEIDKHAIKITQKNYPETIQIGDITKVKGLDLPKIDLLIGGSPCQGFSFAGKGLNFEDKRSKLFFEFVRLKNELKPKWFLLENVMMKQEYIKVISDLMEVDPVQINSALVSAQNRERLYWTNIGRIEKDIFGNEFTVIDLPEDKGILLKDIIEKGGRSRKSGIKTKQMIEVREDFKAGCLTTVQKDSVCIEIGKANIKGNDCRKRVYSIQGKSPTLTAICGGLQEPKISEDLISWRKLTPIECERLQTIPDNYTEGVSNTQRYKMLGNGWTVDIIAHIFNYLKGGVI